MGDETVSPSAKRFNTRENSLGSPQLSITYQAPVPSMPHAFMAVLTAILAVLALWRLRRSSRGVIS